MYVKLVEALCSAHQIPLIKVYITRLITISASLAFIDANLVYR